MKQLLSRKAVSEDEEMRADTCSPMPSAALALPERMPATSIQAVSPHLSERGQRVHIRPDAAIERPSMSHNAATREPQPSSSSQEAMNVTSHSSCAAVCPELLHYMPVASPPVHREVPSLIMKQLIEGEVINKNEGTSTPEHLPIPSLPKHIPILSIQAVSSRQGSDKPQPHPLVVSGQLKPANIVSSSQTVSINACLTMRLNAPTTLASNKAGNRPGVSLPFKNKHQSSPSNTPPDQVEVSLSTKRPTDKMVVSNGQTDVVMCSPILPATITLLKCPPAIPAQAVPHCPSNGETKPLSKMVSKTI
ncbi:hypothetical protein AX14_004524 [Amanita brunnescens Koide BX004]|nr:hypothetical protein AX14_004524 [Amanita brunnescens Koide BX004]